jgi:hypothetical protein
MHYYNSVAGNGTLHPHLLVQVYETATKAESLVIISQMPKEGNATVN